MTSINRDAINRSFVSGLRTAIVIDDDYPNYEILCRAPMKEATEKAWDYERARRLRQGFREKGLTCELENDLGRVNESAKRGDLILLDYHLESNDDDGRIARGVIDSLISSRRQHLVILYTSEPDLRSIWLRLGGVLRGPREQKVIPDDLRDAFDEFVDAAKEARADVSESMLADYLCGGKSWLSEGMREYGFWRNKTQLREFIALQIENRLRGLAPTAPSGAQRFIEMSHSQPYWVRCENLFILIVNKSQQGEDDSLVASLLEKLVDALVGWGPTALRVILNFARRSIIEQGFVGDDRILRDPTSEAGWLLFCDRGVPEGRRERIIELYSRLFEDMVAQALDEIEAFSAGVSPPSASDDQTALALAKQRSSLPSSVTDQDVIHHLNDYLAFEQRVPAYLRTGTIFEIPGEVKRYAICVTPDCDLVPRSPSSDWGRRLDPFLPILFLPVTMSESVQNALVIAEQSKRLFRSHENKRKVIHLDHMGAHPRPELMFVENLGRISGGQFTAHTVGTAGQALAFGAPIACQVVAQLRPRYAMRILHESGQYLSRVGVDFVSWPPQNR